MWERSTLSSSLKPRWSLGAVQAEDPLLLVYHVDLHHQVGYLTTGGWWHRDQASSGACAPSSSSTSNQDVAEKPSSVLCPLKHWVSPSQPSSSLHLWRLQARLSRLIFQLLGKHWGQVMKAVPARRNHDPRWCTIPVLLYKWTATKGSMSFLLPLPRVFLPAWPQHASSWAFPCCSPAFHRGSCKHRMLVVTALLHSSSGSRTCVSQCFTPVKIDTNPGHTKRWSQ